MEPDTLFPQTEMAQDALDDLALIYKGNNTHLAGACRTNQRVGLPDLFDEFTPLGRWRSAGTVFGDIDDLDPGIGRLPFPAFGLLIALPAHLV